MLAWMAATQGPAVSRLPPGRLKPGARRIDLEGAAADRINWIAHNYEHLLEQSTILCAPNVILLDVCCRDQVPRSSPSEMPAIAWTLRS